MELELIFRELRSFKHSLFGSFFCTVGHGNYVISCSYSFQLLFLKLCRDIVDILKMCMWVLDLAEINFAELWLFKISHFWQLFPL